MKPQPFTKEILKKEGIDSDNHLVGFSVREPGPAAPDLNIEQYHAILANTADYMVERFDITAWECCGSLFSPISIGT